MIPGMTEPIADRLERIEAQLHLVLAILQNAPWRQLNVSQNYPPIPAQRPAVDSLKHVRKQR